MQALQISCMYQARGAVRQLSSGSKRLVWAARHTAPQGRRGRASLVVQANELNKWANRDGGDEFAGEPDDGFDRDTAAVVLRVLTARATQQVLMELQEVDIFVCQWLNNFAADNPPTTGNKFILKLFAQLGKSVTDPTSGAKHNIDPQTLAHRILQVRENMAKSIMSGFNKYVVLENTEVMRTHLVNNSYTSGNLEKGKGGNQDRRRGSIRRTSSNAVPRPSFRSKGAAKDAKR